jgi:hypothetical protein
MDHNKKVVSQLLVFSVTLSAVSIPEVHSVKWYMMSTNDKY